MTGRRVFTVGYITMLLFLSVQAGLVFFLFLHQLNPLITTIILLGYWAIVAFLFSIVTTVQIKTRYDIPLHKLSNAAKRVAEGDFSTYLQPIHSVDKYDYIDIIFTDFNVMTQELGSIETLKDDFIANVSHEIKTPLAVVKSYTGMLKNKNLPENTRRDYMNVITRATDNLSFLVSNILRLNKLDNQEIKSAVEEYDLCRQLCDCALQFETLWEKKNITLNVDIEEKVIIFSYKEMLEIVWNNLLSNALKFTGSLGEITLMQTSNAETITVIISDTGCGMDNETRKHIFDKFYQGNESHSDEGNGLGLTLVHRVLEKIGGSITVVSELNGGSTFTVTIPRTVNNVGWYKK